MIVKNYEHEIVSGSLQISQQNLTVSHQFNLYCNSQIRNNYTTNTSHVSRLTASHGA